MKQKVRNTFLKKTKVRTSKSRKVTNVRTYKGENELTLKSEKTNE